MLAVGVVNFMAGADIVDMAGAAAMVGAIDIVVAVDITGAAVEMVGTV